MAGPAYSLFQPGHPNYMGGSTPNLARMSRKTLADLNFDPLKEAVARYRDPETPNASKDYCLGLITDRVLPKLKAIEVTGGQTAQQVLINVLAASGTNVTPIADARTVPIGQESVAIENDEQLQALSDDSNAP